MKTTIISVAACIVALFICSDGTFAARQTKKGQSAYPNLIAASEIKGSKVINLQNQEIGYIDEVLLDPDTGEVRFAVLNVGGFLGVGGTKVAVPWGAFQIAKEGDKPKYVLDATKERLQNAPKVEGRHYERLYTRETAEPIFVYWHVTWVEPTDEAGPANSP
jgi:sporulation protein YlmC with PRC-barrel domain